MISSTPLGVKRTNQQPYGPSKYGGLSIRYSSLSSAFIATHTCRNRSSAALRVEMASDLPVVGISETGTAGGLYRWEGVG